MTNANWQRRVKMLRRKAAELRAEDFRVMEPDALDTPPSKRYGQPAPEPERRP